MKLIRKEFRRDYLSIGVGAGVGKAIFIQARFIGRGDLR